VTKAYGQSTVARILDLVENAGSRKARAEHFITRFARVYTPAVCGAALLLAVLPPAVSLLLGKNADWGEWIYRALTFLVISCPCALVISIPLSFFGGIGKASREGVLVKGSVYLEELSGTKCVVFDKTGTMTKGVFEVSEILSEGVDKDELLRLTAYAEAYSTHPISASIRAAFGSEIDLAKVQEVQEISGHGVTALVDGVRVAAGNSKLMEKIGAACVATELPGTAVYVALDGVYAGCILINDTIKDGAVESIDLLRRNGVNKTVMLTGDRKAAAESVAKTLGVDEVHSELLPADKVAVVEQLLKTTDGRLAFVGDGINDAPVLTRADIGIAMGALGSDAAIEAADIVLMDDDPRSISKAIGISRKCLRIVHENIWFALGVKGICLVLGALGIANMWLAIFADVGVMVLAVINAVRCLK
jgi:Cd2+/Zn2+-exporting ATPase